MGSERLAPSLVDMLPPIKIEIRERGPVPRKMKSAHNQAAKSTWAETGLHFHAAMSDDRFTQAHASLAGFQKRTKAYTSRKFQKFGHTRPLEYSGTTRRLVRTANIVSTSKGAEVRYPGARAFNFRNPKARQPINMAEEFRRIIPQEAVELAVEFDRQYDQKINSIQ